MSIAKKCELYKVVTRPVVTYSEETGVMNRADNKTVTTFEWKILRKLF
jgi:hypothetical protein